MNIRENRDAEFLAAKALDGDSEALRELIARPELLDSHGLISILPALALEGKALALEVPTRWTAALRHAFVSGVHLEWSMERVGEVLDANAIPWMPFKGMDLRSRLWHSPSARPTSDLDILVPKDRLAEVRRLLETAGWKGVVNGDVFEDYLWSEGNNWQAINRIGTVLELHFRLWGAVPEKWIDDIWQRSIPAPELGQAARRPAWSDAFLLCAVHLWIQGKPRGTPFLLLYFRELELIARQGGESVLQQVAASARQWGLSLQICLAAWNAARLWQNPAMQALAVAMQNDLRLPESLLLWVARKHGVDIITLEHIAAVRLLSGRNSRMGSKAAYRRVWPHPAYRR